jgi:eukaryotic-like serine/threonine-protein kinase
MRSEGEQGRRLFEAEGEDNIFGGEWSPDGQRIGYLRLHQMRDKGEFSIESRDLAGGSTTTAIRDFGHVWDWSWSPDGRIIYTLPEPGPPGESCNFWARRIDTPTGKPLDDPKRLTNWAGFCMDSSSLTPDGKHLVFRKWSWQGYVDVADLRANGMYMSTPKRLTQNEGRNYPASWTADSKAVVFGAYRDSQWKILKQFLNKDTAEPVVTTTEDMLGAQAHISPDGAWILYLAPAIGDVDAFGGVRLMRAPINGGLPELVLTARIPEYGVYNEPVCARAPATLCVITEQSEDRKQFIFTSFDPMKGRGRELARFDVSPGAYDWDLSPDGTHMAVIKYSEALIHVLSFDGKPPTEIDAKDRTSLQTVNWAADGKGVLASSATPQGSALLHLDSQGNAHVLWRQKGSIAPWNGDYEIGLSGPSAPWAVPSPDGRHVAIYHWSLSGNMWMMDNF